MVGREGPIRLDKRKKGTLTVGITGGAITLLSVPKYSARTLYIESQQLTIRNTEMNKLVVGKEKDASTRSSLSETSLSSAVNGNTDYINFIDLQKTLDSVHGDRSYGIPSNTVNIVQQIYKIKIQIIVLVLSW